ncbi:MAG: hypothetical protein QOH09_928 [Pseudonocardiales bacterium]|jgi:hypothetical protein|nr:hypothetical protein [Pseudonocardiales bacterium]MDT7714936.1 hypothetical protein [Pseudonocardiales bacterium]
MCDPMSFAELDREYVELLPARTVLSMGSPQIPIGDASGNGIGDGAVSSTMTMLGLTNGSHGANGASADGSDGGIA